MRLDTAAALRLQIDMVVRFRNPESFQLYQAAKAG